MTVSNDTSSPEPLAPSELRWSCAPQSCAARGSAATTVGFGQERAVAALRFGIAMPAAGYNVFVTGSGGSGRRSTVEEIVRQLAARASEGPLLDHAYVHNFDDPSRPRLLSLPKGQARRFQLALAELISDARAQIPAVLEGDRLHAERERVESALGARMKANFEPFDRKIATDGLVLVSNDEDSSLNPEIQASIEGRPIPVGMLRADPAMLTAFQSSHPGSIDALEAKVEALAEELEDLLRIARHEARLVQREVETLERKAVAKIIQDMMSELTQSFTGPDLRRHLQQLESHLLSNLEWFKSEPEAVDDSNFGIYGVNIVRDASSLAGAPVLVEANPSYANLFGTIDRGSNEVGPELAAVRSGALLRADGGYLLLQVGDLLTEPGVWRTLVRTLRSQMLEIRAPESAVFVPGAIQPDAIAISVKVVLVGDEPTYQGLAASEPDFARVFKVKAEFEDEIDATPQNVAGFAAVARAIAGREEQLPLEDEALARLAEHAARLAGRRSKLSTNFGAIADLIREADQWARGEGRPVIQGVAIEAAIEQAKGRHDRVARQIDEAVREGRLRISTSGHRVGEVNALGVIDQEPSALGVVLRVSAAAGPGRRGVVNVEREAHLSGPHHDKGVCLLTGYLRQRYREVGHLSVNASVAFEQSYAPIDGDSASIAELCALLSAIAELPIAQRFAITGAVDQHGGVHAVGGVNEKVEAWYRVARALGEEGPITAVIPEANRGDLMLAREVVEGAGRDRIRVCVVRDIDQALSLLFQRPASEVHAGVRTGLERLAQRPNAQK